MGSSLQLHGLYLLDHVQTGSPQSATRGTSFTAQVLQLLRASAEVTSGSGARASTQVPSMAAVSTSRSPSPRLTNMRSRMQLGSMQCFSAVCWVAVFVTPMRPIPTQRSFCEIALQGPTIVS